MSLTFLHGGIALLGVAAAAVPIVIHLLLRQRPRPFDFPALRLIRQRRTRTVRHLRLRHLLLLALRIALLLLLALALARPTIHSRYLPIDQAAPVAAALVVDNSLSMGYGHEGKTRLQVAQELAGQVIQELPEGSELTVVETGGTASHVPLDVPRALGRLRAIQIGSQPGSVTRALTQAYQALAKSLFERREVYVVSDLAASGWDLGERELLEQAAQLAGPGLRIYVIDVGVAKPQNVSLGEVQVPRRVLSVHDDLDLALAVRNTGPAVDRTVELFLDDQPRDQKAVHLPGGEATQIRFAVGGLSAAIYQGRVVLASDDPLAFDDVRHFTIEVHAPIRTLVVYDGLGDAFHWLTALKTVASRYAIDGVESPKLLTLDLAQYQTISLLNVGSLPDEAWLRLGQFVREGGGLFVALGERVDPVNYSSPAAQTVLPGRLVEEIRSDDGEFLSPLGLSHPLSIKFRQWENSDLEVQPVLRYWRVEPVRGAAVVLSLSGAGRNPGLLERALGRGALGRSLLLTTAAHYQSANPWSELPLGWSYLVLVHEATQYLAGMSEKRLDFLPGNSVEIPLGPGDPFVSFTVTDPEGQHERLSVEPRETALVVPEVRLLGNYRVESTADGRTFSAGFSVNAPVRESDLEPLEAAALKQLLGAERTKVAGSLAELDRAVDEGRVGRELFAWVMILVIVVLLVEGHLANRFYRRPVPSPPP